MGKNITNKIGCGTAISEVNGALVSVEARWRPGGDASHARLREILSEYENMDKGSTNPQHSLPIVRCTKLCHVSPFFHSA